jgi:hypothetical protein
MAVRYLCYHQNKNESYVANPDGSLIDSLLDSRSPVAGVTMDPSDPSTYTSNPIVVPELPVTGKAWPVALYELLEPNGFGMVFRLEADGNGDPYTRLDLFRRQDGSAATYKDLYLQLSGNPLDPSLTNLARARLARDTAGVANVFSMESNPVRYEASFILAPGFPILQSDAATAASIGAFDLTSPTFSQTNRDKYRLYVFDETGEGHWNFATSATVHDAPSLQALLSGSAKDPRTYVKRRRVPMGELFTTDSNNMRLKARLSISTIYAGASPGLWDGTGTWQPIVGGFRLLQDRLGIWISVPNPNGWNIGLPATSGMPFPAGTVRGIEDQANSSATHFSLRLTCVIEGDLGLDAVATQRPSSSTSFAIMRRIDASDRYFKQVVAANSEFNASGQPITIRDDTDDALSEAAARRLAGEAGEVAGSVTVPRFTTAYQIGDKIQSIVGRDLSLRTNAGAPLEDGQVFPTVVALSWDFNGKQQTELQLSDHRGQR